MGYLEGAAVLGIPAPLEAKNTSGGTVCGLEGVSPLELPGNGEVPSALRYIIAGLQHRPAQFPVRVHVLNLAGDRLTKGVAHVNLVGGIEGNGPVESRPFTLLGVGVGQIHRLVHQTDGIHELESHILKRDKHKRAIR